MKKLIAKRRLKYGCDQCHKPILKGDTYFKKRIIRPGEIVIAYDMNYCPKCKYKNEQHEKRFEEFKKRCEHPKKFIETEWDYIPGECVKEPQYDYCRLCGEILD